MTNKDKVIAVFLASVGVLSSVQAIKYVGTLSAKEKKVVLSVAKKATTQQILLCSGQTNMNVVETKSGA